MTTRFAWRYFWSKKSANAINIISWISVVAIGVVTAALMVVLSVFNGFENLVESLYGDFYADIRVAPARGKWMVYHDSLQTRIRAALPQASLAPVIEERAILMDQEDKSIVWLKGVPADYGRYSGVDDHMIRGEFITGNADTPGIVLGAGVENALQILAGRTVFPITVYLPNRFATQLSDPMEALHSAPAVATGSFLLQQEFDNQYAFASLPFMQYMLDLDSGQCSAVELFLPAGTDLGRAGDVLQDNLGSGYEIKTRFQQNQGLYSAMQTERLIIYGVAGLILIIAAFNIISSLTMTVLEKQPDIAVLNAMGASPERISRIFLKLGGILAGFGGLAGFLVGIAICLGQQHFHWVKLGGQSFIIDYYPIAMRYQDFAAVGSLVLAVAFLSGWLPSRKAGRSEYSLKS